MLDAELSSLIGVLLQKPPQDPYKTPLILSGFFAGLGASCPVREGDSGSKGRGVFATRAISCGEICTMYPCDYLKLSAPGSPGSDLVCLRVGATAADAARVDGYAQFLRRSEDGKVFEVCGDPARPFRPGASGHLINDPHPDVGKICRLPGDSASYGRGLLEYMVRTQGLSNCFLKPHASGQCVMVVATRDISSGEELLAPYGYEYWIDVPDAGPWLEEFMASPRPAGAQHAMLQIMSRYLSVAG